MLNWTNARRKEESPRFQEDEDVVVREGDVVEETLNEEAVVVEHQTPSVPSTHFIVSIFETSQDLSLMLNGSRYRMTAERTSNELETEITPQPEAVAGAMIMLEDEVAVDVKLARPKQIEMNPLPMQQAEGEVPVMALVSAEEHM
jgi:hypothetical protein